MFPFVAAVATTWMGAGPLAAFAAALDFAPVMVGQRKYRTKPSRKSAANDRHASHTRRRDGLVFPVLTVSAETAGEAGAAGGAGGAASAGVRATRAGGAISGLEVPGDGSVGVVGLTSIWFLVRGGALLSGAPGSQL